MYPRLKTVCLIGTAVTENNPFLVNKYDPDFLSKMTGFIDNSNDFLLRGGTISFNKNDLLLKTKDIIKYKYIDNQKFTLILKFLEMI
jgi:hypothetical protein